MSSDDNDEYEIQDIEDYFEKKVDGYKYIEVYRNDILFDSISELKNNDIEKKRIRINFINEDGYDDGGLFRDWLTTISQEIIDIGAIITTPDGEYYKINENYEGTEIFTLIGQILGISFNNQESNSIKLMSSIWKFIFEKNINIEDMKEYDYYIYQSLKSIQQNDVQDMYLTFVDSKGEELCYNGNEKEVTNDNKKEYIDLMIEKKLIGDYSKINAIKIGFETAVNISECSNIGWETIRDFIKGKDDIDVEEWKDNCRYSSSDEEYVESFFDIISEWEEEKLKKLLKFITGTSVVPVEGFEYFEKLGGKINIKFTDYDTNSFPISHTCYNQIELPRYDSNDDFEEKLLTAIEVEDFGFS